MPKFDVVVAHCDRYAVDAENEDAALKQIRDAYYAGNLHAYHYGSRGSAAPWKTAFEDQHVDFFTKFESEGEIEDE